MSHCLKLSADYICEISFSLQWYVKITLQIRTRFKCSRFTLEYSEMEPVLQCQRQTTCWTHRHWSLVQGLLRESWIWGYPDNRTIYFGRTVGPWRCKIQDFVPCPYGTFLGVEGKLGDTDMQISYHCNRLCVTLTLSSVYINQRVLVRRTTYRTTIIP